MAFPPSSPASHGKATTEEEASQLGTHPFITETFPFSNIENIESRRSRRALSSTSPDPRLSASFSTRLRARTSPQSNEPPLHIDLSSTALRPSRSPRVLHTLAESPSEKASAPIDIPARKRGEGQLSRPTTPLTARAPQGQYFTSWHKAEPRISESLTPYYSSRVQKISGSRDPSAALKGLAKMSPRSETASHRPSSPLSPRVSGPLPSAKNRRQARAPMQSLNLAGLPKYHPANFPSMESSSAPPSHLSSRSVTSQPRSSRDLGAKKQLLQYQRDIVYDTAKASRSPSLSSESSKPSPPRLNPLISPGEPMTPFVLEGAGDYMVAGSSSFRAESEEGEGGDFVEPLVRRENERRSHTEAISRTVSPALSLSPAVSPAGGRG